MKEETWMLEQIMSLETFQWPSLCYISAMSRARGLSISLRSLKISVGLLMYPSLIFVLLVLRHLAIK